ncbi:MAG: glycosyltransferase, partial [Chloroflexales bacterium]|nr:glycosyltransferase [Chloroflexales bacterium]
GSTAPPAQPSAHPVPAYPAPPRPTLTTDQLLNNRRLRWDGWAISQPLALALLQALKQRAPKRILELGSGISSVVLAHYAAEHGAELVSLEHDKQFYEQTRRLLADTGLSHAVQLVLAPLTTLEVGDQRYAWYDAPLSGSFDFIFVDGPPVKHGRQAALPALKAHLAPGWQLWLKDGNRSHEQACIALWRGTTGCVATLHPLDPRGVWIVGAAAQQAPTALPVAPARAAEPQQIAPATSDPPMVSCIMPTYNRHRFVPQAIAYFLRQDYPNRELIIVEDGAESAAPLIPPDPRIRYVRLPGRQSIGAKRNFACDLAAGEIVICWDDDDWYGPRRISQQVAPLLSGRAEFTGLEESLLLCLPTAQFWACAPHLHARMFVDGVVSGTLAFKKAIWGRPVRFPNASLAEDAGLQRELTRSGARLEKVPNDGLFVYIRHDTNSWRFTPGEFLDRSGWQLVSPPSYMPAGDRAFYAVGAQP